MNVPEAIRKLATETARGVTDLPARLVGLSELEYQQQRTALAKDAGLGVGALDSVRRAARKAARRKASRAAAEPWPDPVDGESLAAGVEVALRRFVVLAGRDYTLVTLWAVGTHAHAARSVYPLLLARSPQPACGKSTLIDVLERLVARPFVAANASLATLFRSAATGPTQLLDELDRWLERDPEIVSFLCAGWQSGRPFVRCHPETLELQEFPCYGPRALALIGDLRDEALRSRCIAIEMRRALPGERAERFRASRSYHELTDLQRQAARWALDNAEGVGAYELKENDFPELSGRAADNAEALLAVAEGIGGEWPARCRKALLAVPVEEPQDLGAMLLADLATLLEKLDKDSEAIATAQILEHLLALDDRPWLTVRRGAEPLEANGLRRRLAPFGIKPGRAYIDGTRQRAYSVAPIREAIARYIPPSPAPTDQVSQVSQVSHPVVSDALGAPERVSTGHQDTRDTSQEGPGNGGIRGRVAPLAEGSELWNELQERAAVLEREADLHRADAELWAADELGLLL